MQTTDDDEDDDNNDDEDDDDDDDDNDDDDDKNEWKFSVEVKSWENQVDEAFSPRWP